MNTKVTIAGVELKNPVMTASGTFGSGQEYGEFVNLEYSMAWKPNSQDCRGLWRYAQCYWTSKSRN